MLDMRQNSFTKTVCVGGFANENYWSSSENNSNNAWNQNFNNGNQNNNKRVRAVRGFNLSRYSVDYRQNTIILEAVLQLELFPYHGIENCSIKADELFQAYFDCRSNKRRTANAMTFEVDYESKLIQLLEDINTGNYYPSKSIAIIVNRPVKREISAADFRDRIVHHLIINKLNPLFEKDYIRDSFACRVGKGTHYGIKRVDKFIKKCSKNYTEDCFVLKLDKQAFFMNINKELLFNKLQSYIVGKYHLPDQKIVIDLCRKIIFYSPIDNCIIKGFKSDWEGLLKVKVCSIRRKTVDCLLEILQVKSLPIFI